jgi:hypothetical protein
MPNSEFPNVTALAEAALIERQSLQVGLLEAETVRPSYDGLGLANVPALAMHWLGVDRMPDSSTALPPFNPSLLENPVVLRLGNHGNGRMTSTMWFY